MFFRAWSERPAELSFGPGDPEVIDVSVYGAHQYFRVELPIFIAVGAESIARVVVAFVGEADSNPIVEISDLA